MAVEQIPANGSVRLSSFNLTLSANYFTQLTERLSGNLKIEITAEAEPIFCQTYPIDILAYDQWGGLNVLPEMLAAFITPNHTAISPIIKRATSILGQWTGNPSLDEYQSRTPDRVRKQMAAIYTAIAEQQIIYSTVPASFEEYGQRVRLADSVMAQKIGNLPGYGFALCFLSGGNRAECFNRHHARACLCRSLAGAGNFPGSYD